MDSITYSEATEAEEKQWFTVTFTFSTAIPVITLH